MKARSVNISTLKSNLSKYLKLVRNGDTLLVTDRADPVAELKPAPADALDPWERLARRFPGVRVGTQDWKGFAVRPLKKKVPILELLAEVRRDRA
jgi:prevent-host-death family protein